MPGPSGESCGACYFWERYWERYERDGEMESDYGGCFRFPPAFKDEHNPADNQPATYADIDWCGEFRQR